MLKPWHRFELIDVLETAIGSSAEAWVLEWDGLTWSQTGEYVTVHNYNGRHFGLPGEKGWARCEGDSKKPEVVSLGGLIRMGQLASDLLATGFAATSILNDPLGTGTPTSSGYQRIVHDFMLPTGGKLFAGDKIWMQFDCVSQEWFLLSAISQRPILGKTETDIKNGNSGLINVYSGTPGSETQPGTLPTITAFNKFYGFIPEDTWVLCENNGSGWYIVAVMRGNNLMGRVGNTRFDQLATTNAYSGTTFGGVTVYLLADGATAGVPNIGPLVVTNLPGNPTVTAYPLVSVVDGEIVELAWTGTALTIVKGQFDGGFYGKTQSAIAKGASSANCLVSGNFSTTPAITLSAAVLSPFGAVDANKLVWIERSAFGYYITSAEC